VGCIIAKSLGARNLLDKKSLVYSHRPGELFQSLVVVLEENNNDNDGYNDDLKN